MKTNTLRSHPNPSIRLRASLLQLQEALTVAGSAVPARPPRVDVNEQRAIQLIARVQARYKCMPFVGLQDIPSPHGARVNVHLATTVHAG